MGVLFYSMLESDYRDLEFFIKTKTGNLSVLVLEYVNFLGRVLAFGLVINFLHLLIAEGRRTM